MEKQQVSKLNYLHIAPRKVRLVTDTLKGLPVQEAETQLMLRPNRASKPVLKLLKSAVSNAKNNKKLNPSNLVIKSVRVDNGPMLKRFLPRAMGRATPIQKKMSHVTLILEESLKPIKERFTITPPPKKVDKSKRKAKKSSAKGRSSSVGKKPDKKPEKKEMLKKEKKGILKRIFRRKAV